MSIQEVSAEKLAELLHHYHQVLGPDFGCSKEATESSWDHMPEAEKNRSVAAARLTLLEIAATDKKDDSRRYFAKPGEAQWGC